MKQEVDDDISLCVNERSPWPIYNWRYKDLSMSRDQKVMKLLTQLRSALSTNKFDNSSPSVTPDKEICHVIMS